MMYSDYFAISTCAISVMFMPFMLIAQIRFAHILQDAQYANRQYFKFIFSNFKLFILPSIVICGIAILGAIGLSAYVMYNPFYEMMVLIMYAVCLLIVCAVLAVACTIYIKRIKMESEKTPLICSPRLVHVFLLSCAMVCALSVVVNVFVQIDIVVYGIMFLTPFAVPLANLIIKTPLQAQEQ